MDIVEEQWKANLRESERQCLFFPATICNNVWSVANQGRTPGHSPG